MTLALEMVIRDVQASLVRRSNMAIACGGTLEGVPWCRDLWRVPAQGVSESGGPPWVVRGGRGWWWPCQARKHVAGLD